MFNPITIIQSVWKWFVNAFSQLVSFSKQKFLLVTIALFAIGWYYIKCYETPIFHTGYNLQLVNAELLCQPSVSLNYSFNHNNFSERKTSYSFALDNHIIIQPATPAVFDSCWFVRGSKTVDLSKSMHWNRKQELSCDTARFGIMLNMLMPLKQPFFFKHPYSNELAQNNYYLTGLRNFRVHNDQYKSQDVLAMADVYYATEPNPDQLYVVFKDTFEYPIICKPQWQCKGDLSSFIFKFNDSTYCSKRDLAEIKASKIDKLSCEFNDYIHIVTMTPMPDSIWTTGFAFTKAETLALVQQNGINGFAKFPGMEAWQMVRTFALTTLLATLFSLFIGMLYNFIGKYPLIKSLANVAITIFLVCLAVTCIVYADFSAVQVAYQNSEHFVVILHLLFYLIVCLITCGFVYHLFRTYTLSIWVFVLEALILFVFSRAMYTMLWSEWYDEQHLNIYVFIVLMLLVSIFLPTICAVAKKYQTLANRFKRTYGRRLVHSNDFAFPTIALALILLPYIVIISIARIHDIDNIVLVSTIATAVVIILEMLLLSLLLNRTKTTNRKIETQWKRVARQSVLCQSFTIGLGIIIALIFPVLHKDSMGVLATVAFSISLLIISSPLWILPYLYKPSLSVRYYKFTKLKQKKFIKRIYKIDLSRIMQI